MAVNIGPKIGIDGEAEYRRQMNNIIQQAKTLSSEMKTVTSAFNAETSAEQKAAAQKGVLTKQIETQKERVALLAKGLEEATQKFGESDTKTLKWKQALNEATAELNTMEQELDDVGDGAKKAGDSFDEAGQGALSFGDLIKANVISDAIMEGLHAVADAAKQIGEAFIDIGKQALSNYSDYEQLTGGVKKLFGDAYDQVIADSERAYKESGLSANEYMETATSFSASLIAGLSGDTEKATQLTNKAIGDMSDNANTFGTDIASIQNAYQGFAKQNYTMLDNLKLGYGGTQAEMARLINESGVLGDAIEVTANTVNDVSFDKMIEAIHVVQENMGITGTTAKEASGTIEGSVNSMKAAWQNLLTAFAADDLDLGTYVENFVDSVKTAASNIVPRIMTIIPNMAEGLGQIIDAVIEELPNIIDQAMQALPTLANAGLQIVGKLGDGIAQALPQLKQSAGTIFQNLITNLQENLPQMVKSGLDAVTSFSEGFGQNLGSLIDAGIELIKTLADGIIQALPDLIVQIPQIVANIVTGITENAPKLIIAAAEIIFQLVVGLIQAIPTIIANMPKIIEAITTSITGVNWLGLGQEIFTFFANGIKSMVGSIASAVKYVLSNPIQFLTSLASTFQNLARNAMSFFGNGISSMGSAVASAVNSALSGAISIITSLPSKAIGWGKDFINGMAQGIISAAQRIYDAVSNIASKIRSKLHFSRPDEGPLRDYETWMPDFIDGMAQGIYKNAYKLENAVTSLASGMNVNLSGGVSGSVGGTYSINVYPSQGMNENQLANLVMQKMQHQVRQREAVFG